MSDIVERLRDLACGGSNWNNTLTDAADEIERLRAALDQKNAEYEDLKQTMHNMTRNHALQLDAARMAGVHSVQIQTAVIVRAALELLDAAGDTFPPERLAAFQRVFGGAAPGAPGAQEKDNGILR